MVVSSSSSSSSTSSSIGGPIGSTKSLSYELRGGIDPKRYRGNTSHWCQYIRYQPFSRNNRYAVTAGPFGPMHCQVKAQLKRNHEQMGRRIRNHTFRQLKRNHEQISRRMKSSRKFVEQRILNEEVRRSANRKQRSANRKQRPLNVNAVLFDIIGHPMFSKSSRRKSLVRKVTS